MSEERLIKALEDLTEKIDDMSEKLGRGTKSKTSQVPGGKSGSNAKTPEEKALAAKTGELSKLAQLGVDTQKKSNRANKDQIDSIKDLTKAQKEAEEEQKKLERSMERAKDGFQSFGQALMSDKVNISSAFGQLGGVLTRSTGVLGKSIGGVASGVGFAIGAMQNFAENAKDMGTFADLGAFQVGSVRQAKILSGLGDSFIKVIEQSNGTFKALGGNSQDAVDNLSNLSRALRYGSGYLNSAMRKSLGTDLVKSVDKAARATAAMGLSQEDTANLSGSILASTMLNAKNEDDAKQKFVKAMAESVTSARGLSDAFGISAKSVLAAMAEFRKTQAGTVASLEGNVGADQMYALLKERIPNLSSDPAKMANIAMAMSEGNLSKAQYNISDNPEATQALQQIFGASRGTFSEKGFDVEQFNKNIEAQRGAIELEYASRKGQQGFNDKNAAPAIQMMALLRQRDIATGKIAPDKAAKDKLAGKSEADNIQTMNSLTAAIDSLRAVMIGLTAGVLALLGPVLSIALSGGIGGMLATKGLKGTLMSLIKMPGAIAMATAEFYKTSGGFKGMWESTKAFGSTVWDATSKFGKGMWDATKAFGSTVWDATSKFGKGMWESTKAMYANAGGVTGMLKSVKDFGMTLWQAGAKAVASLWTMAVTAYQTVVPALVAMARSAWASMAGGLGNLGKVLGPVAGAFGKIAPWLARVGGIFLTWGTKLLPILGGAFQILTGPIGWLIAGATLLYTFWDEIVDVSKSVWQGFTNLVSWLGTGAGAIWDAITTPFVALFDWLGAGASKIWDIITAPFTALFDWLGNSWLGKKMGFGDSTVSTKPDTSNGKVATLDQINAAKDALRYGNSNDMSDKGNVAGNGQIVKSITPVEFASISTPPSINSDFGKTSADADLAKAPNENSVLKDIASGLTPEAISQLMGYLSSMQNDLSAIRSNTKTDSFSAPVRLA